MMNKITVLIITSWAITITSTAMAERIDIFAAARQGDISAIKAYALKGGNVNISNSKSHTPFILAAYYGHLQALDTLLQIGADACAMDNKGSNAFMGVAFKGHNHVAQWLLDNTSCAVNHRNYAGQTALMMASLFGREVIIKQLLEHGADADLKDHQGNTSAKLAQAQGLNHIVEIIKFHMQ